VAGMAIEQKGISGQDVLGVVPVAPARSQGFGGEAISGASQCRNHTRLKLGDEVPGIRFTARCGIPPHPPVAKRLHGWEPMAKWCGRRSAGEAGKGMDVAGMECCRRRVTGTQSVGRFRWNQET
jgi:hypothetical protein